MNNNKSVNFWYNHIEHNSEIIELEDSIDFYCNDCDAQIKMSRKMISILLKLAKLGLKEE